MEGEASAQDGWGGRRDGVRNECTMDEVGRGKQIYVGGGCVKADIVRYKNMSPCCAVP